MPLYQDLKSEKLYATAEAQWIAERLLDLRGALARPAPLGIPARRLDQGLVAGSWNLRDFDTNAAGHGPRLPEAFHFIAELLARFDVAVLSEIGEDLTALRTITRLAGPGYRFLTSDASGPADRRRRIAFVYDARVVTFNGVAGNLSLHGDGLAQPCFAAGFSAGWFRFHLCTLHAAPGGDAARLGALAAEIDVRAKAENSNFLLFGDFSIAAPVQDAAAVLARAGFVTPASQAPPDGAGQFYDQMAYQANTPDLRLQAAGAFDWRAAVFRDQDYLEYARRLPVAHRKFKSDDRTIDPVRDREYYAQIWRTYQMSDHLPLWATFDIDGSDAYLSRIATGTARRAPLLGDAGLLARGKDSLTREPALPPEKKGWLDALRGDGARRKETRRVLSEAARRSAPRRRGFWAGLFSRRD